MQPATAVHGPRRLAPAALRHNVLSAPKPTIDHDATAQKLLARTRLAWGL